MGVYQIFFANRTDTKKGGGSAILVKKEISTQLLFSGTKYGSEIVHIKLFLEKEIHIINVYRPPNCNAPNTKKLLKFLTDLVNKKYVVLCGDFNIPDILWSENKLINRNNSIANMFIEFTYQAQLKQRISEPTRGEAFLDLIFTSNENLIKDINITENFSSSDHRKIEFKVQDRALKTLRPQIYIREHKAKNFSDLNEMLFHANLKGIIITKFSTEAKYTNFSKTLFGFYDQCIPTRPLKKIIRKSYPWRIKKLYDEKMLYYRLSKAYPYNTETKLKLKVISNQLKIQLKSFYDEKENKLISKGKMAIYKYINSKFNNIIANLTITLNRST